MEIIQQIDSAIITYKIEHHYIEPEYLILSHSGIMYLKRCIYEKSKVKDLVDAHIWRNLKIIVTRRSDILFILF